MFENHSSYSLLFIFAFVDRAKGRKTPPFPYISVCYSFWDIRFQERHLGYNALPVENQPKFRRDVTSIFMVDSEDGGDIFLRNVGLI
jgi:hypothetical protein